MLVLSEIKKGKYGNNKSNKAFVEGVTAAVIGAKAGVVVIIATRRITDLATVLIAIASVFIILYFKKIQEPYIIIVAAIVGLILKTSVV